MRLECWLEDGRLEDGRLEDGRLEDGRLWVTHSTFFFPLSLSSLYSFFTQFIHSLFIFIHVVWCGELIFL